MKRRTKRNYTFQSVTLDNLEPTKRPPSSKKVGYNPHKAPQTAL